MTNEVTIMKQENCWDTSDSLTPSYEEHLAQDFVWSTSEQAKLRALSLFIIRPIVERHDGTIDMGLATDTIDIDIPEEEQAACAQEIEEQVGAMCG